MGSLNTLQTPYANSKAVETFTSYSGSDITCVIGNKIVGSLQAISYSVTREKGPIYVMRGQPNPIAFARGKRAIAGTLIFLMIDRTAFLSHMAETQNGTGSNFYGNFSEIKYDPSDIDSKNPEDMFNLAVSGIDNTGDDFSDFTSGGGTGYERGPMAAWYADQVLPFDVNISASNEYGQSSKRSLVGVEMLNEGGGVSIDDLVIEEQYTFIARDITKWVRVMGLGMTR